VFVSGVPGVFAGESGVEEESGEERSDPPAPEEDALEIGEGGAPSSVDLNSSESFRERLLRELLLRSRTSVDASESAEAEESNDGSAIAMLITASCNSTRPLSRETSTTALVGSRAASIMSLTMPCGVMLGGSASPPLVVL